MFMSAPSGTENDAGPRSSFNPSQELNTERPACYKWRTDFPKW